MYKKEKNDIDKPKDNGSKDTLTPCGDKLWKLQEDDDIDVNEVFKCPVIPGTSGVEA